MPFPKSFRGDPRTGPRPRPPIRRRARSRTRPRAPSRFSALAKVDVPFGIANAQTVSVATHPDPFRASSIWIGPGSFWAWTQIRADGAIPASARRRTSSRAAAPSPVCIAMVRPVSPRCTRAAARRSLACSSGSGPLPVPSLMNPGQDPGSLDPGRPIPPASDPPTAPPIPSRHRAADTGCRPRHSTRCW